VLKYSVAGLLTQVKAAQSRVAEGSLELEPPTLSL
jgi:hypothetical protein